MRLPRGRSLGIATVGICLLTPGLKVELRFFEIGYVTDVDDTRLFVK